MRQSISVLAGIAVAILSGVSLAQSTSLVSRGMTPGVATLDGATLAVRVSEGGTREYIHSNASNVVVGDGNGAGDIFYRDADGPWLRAFSGMGGVTPNGDTQEDFSTSTGGRWLIFVSTATNLVPNDTNNSADVFLRDMSTGALQRVNIGNDVVPPVGPHQYRGPSVTNDGAMVCFVTDAPEITGSPEGSFKVVTRNLQTSSNRVTPSQSPSRCAISPNKLGVVFEDFNATSFYGGPTPQIWYHEFAGSNPSVFSVAPGGGTPNGPSTRPLLSGVGFGTLGYTSAASNLVAGDTN